MNPVLSPCDGWTIKKPRRNVCIGLGNSSVNSFSTITFSIVPQVSFRTTRLVIPKDIAKDFYIVDVVGKNHSFAALMFGPFPASIYSEEGDVDFDIGVCPRDELIHFTIECVAQAARRFAGMIMGVEMEKTDQPPSVCGHGYPLRPNLNPPTEYDEHGLPKTGALASYLEGREHKEPSK